MTLSHRELVNGFYDHGYFGTTHDHQQWILKLLIYVGELEDRIARLEAEKTKQPVDKR